MTNSNTIGSRVKALREAKKETQADLARALRVKRETVNQWENETRDLKTQYTVSLSDHFETTCDYILRGIKTENISIYKKTGLSEKAIENIIKFDDEISTYKEIVYNENNEELTVGEITTEFKDILVEILESEFLPDLLLHIGFLRNEYAMVREHIKTIDTLEHRVITKNSLTEKYHFEFWRTNNTAQILINDVLENYYLKTKDVGVKTERLNGSLSGIIESLNSLTSNKEAMERLEREFSLRKEQRKKVEKNNS